MITKVLKILSVALLCIILVMSMPISAFADLLLWHSDSNSVGTWADTQIKYAHKKLNNNSNFYFYASGLYAIGQWEDALNISIENVISMSDANIRVFGGTLDELTALGFYCDKPDVLGFVDRYKSTLISIEILDGRKVALNKFEDAVFVVIDKGLMSNYNYVTTHELGHALGWLGHSEEKKDVMYAVRNSIATLTTRDKEHLLQVY